MMPTATIQQRERRAAIARMLAKSRIARQSVLVDRLRAQGIDATQSSVSRDLKEMGAIKDSGGYRLSHEVADGQQRSLPLIAEFVRDVRAAGPNLLVVATAIGAAQRVALTLDRLGWPELVGTLSGDDTIFIATRSAAEQRRLRARLQKNLRKVAS